MCYAILRVKYRTVAIANTSNTSFEAIDQKDLDMQIEMLQANMNVANIEVFQFSHVIKRADHWVTES